jgi:hypothetical protein
MKKIFLLILLFPLFSIAQQQFQCDFVPDASFYNTSIYSNRSHKIPNINGQRFVFNVKFHHVLGNGDVNQYNLGETSALRMIAQLNIGFNAHNIFFKYRGFDAISNSNFLVFGQNGAYFDTLRQQFVNNGYDDNAINVFIVNSGVQVADGQFKDIFLSASAYNNFMYNRFLSHEMGHILGLFHLESGTNICDNCYITTAIPDCISVESNSPLVKMAKPIFSPSLVYENVTRDPFNSNYNADNQGDWVADTGAAFIQYTYNYDRVPVQENSSCNLNHYNSRSDIVDPTGQVYNGLDNLNGNFMNMSSIFNNTPAGKFTVGQADRMKETIVSISIDGVGALLRQKLCRNADGTANIWTLYQPFQTSRFVTSIASTIDNGDGTAHVCRNYVSSNYRFQPGFDYEFPENQLPDLTTYTVLQTPLVESPAFNCPIKILQLSTDVMEAPTVCRVVFCIDEPFRFGIKYSTQVLGSMNITQEQLSEIQVKDPNLYDTLMSEYYHILKKITASGAEVQTIIYKQ